MGHTEDKLIRQKLDETIFVAAKRTVFAKNMPILKIFLGRFEGFITWSM